MKKEKVKKIGERMKCGSNYLPSEKITFKLWVQDSTQAKSAWL